MYLAPARLGSVIESATAAQCIFYFGHGHPRNMALGWTVLDFFFFVLPSNTAVLLDLFDTFIDQCNLNV